MYQLPVGERRSFHIISIIKKKCDASTEENHASIITRLTAFDSYAPYTLKKILLLSKTGSTCSHPHYTVITSTCSDSTLNLLMLMILHLEVCFQSPSGLDLFILGNEPSICYIYKSLTLALEPFNETALLSDLKHQQAFQVTSYSLGIQ